MLGRRSYLSVAAGAEEKRGADGEAEVDNKICELSAAVHGHAEVDVFGLVGSSKVFNGHALGFADVGDSHGRDAVRREEWRGRREEGRVRSGWGARGATR